MVFTLNVGNTHTSLGLWSRSNSTRYLRWRTGAPLPAAAARALRGAPEPLLIVASVVPHAWQALRRALAPFRPRCVAFRNAVQHDLVIVPRPARRVGEDRLASAFGAAFLDLKKSWVIVDGGTALTVNALRRPPRGPLRFEGGLIAAGAELSLKALGAGTAQLPSLRVPSAFSTQAIGRNTRQALQQGALLAQWATAVHLAQLQRKELGEPCGVVLTGGLSRNAGFARAFVKSFPRGVARVEPDLVHKGLFTAFFSMQLGPGVLRAQPR